eukprot:gnl/Chilomastix_cuspidata/4131.p1 GENE.gnl/Chilomastix_cuspidata/4131~~gnl/Chilomastix_cuspidata/4131.p1  ORF type:complete len:154 (+),score=7.75 gnl/Chilomastix_cuspidata/4131:70-531(+)
MSLAELPCFGVLGAQGVVCYIRDLPFHVGNASSAQGIHFQIDARGISRHHLSIIYSSSERSFMAVVTGKNGAIIDGTYVKPLTKRIPISHGSRIRLPGMVMLRLTLPDSTQEPRTSSRRGISSGSLTKPPVLHQIGALSDAALARLAANSLAA